MSSTFKLITEHKIKTLEEETMLGLYDIIDRMHKHAVEDYINVISCYYDEDLDEVKSEVEFNKIFKKNVFEMFEHIKDDLEYRVQDLKLQLMKRFDIESDFKELLSESESESESKSKLRIFGPKENREMISNLLQKIKSKPENCKSKTGNWIGPEKEEELILNSMLK